MYRVTQFKPALALEKAYNNYLKVVEANGVPAAERCNVAAALDRQLSRLAITLKKVFNVVEDSWYANEVTDQYLGGLSEHPEVITFTEFNPNYMGTQKANGLPLPIWLKRYFDTTRRAENEPAIGFKSPDAPFIASCAVYGDKLSEDKFYIVLPEFSHRFYQDIG